MFTCMMIMMIMMKMIMIMIMMIVMMMTMMMMMMKTYPPPQVPIRVAAEPCPRAAAAPRDPRGPVEPGGRHPQTPPEGEAGQPRLSH